MDNGVQTRTYTLMMLVGAELGRDKAIKDYELKSKWRVLPKQFGEYRGEKILEIEQICVGTKTMSYQEYLNCRNYSFIAKLLGHHFLQPIIKLTKKIGIDWFELSLAITNKIKNQDNGGKFKELFDDFCKESHEELFESKEEAIEFYSKNSNYKSLLAGDIGENLMSKYTARGVLVLDDIISTLFQVIRENFESYSNEQNKLILNSAEIWMKNLYLINEIYSDQKLNPKNNEIDLKFDFPEWLSRDRATRKL